MILQLAALALSVAIQTAETPVAAPPADADADKKICKREEPIAGSRLARGKEVCRTAAEWRAERDRTDADLDRARR